MIQPGDLSLDLQERYNSLRAQLLDHSLFSQICNMQRLHIFMEAHVFAVWDFMSLAKRIQFELTGSRLPWLPPEDPVSARLINEIILAEESDVDPNGGFLSHFELYLLAMQELGAQTDSIRQFVAHLKQTGDFAGAIQVAQVPDFVKDFIESSLDVALRGSLEAALGYFFYGREELIPQMFRSLLQSWDIRPDKVPKLYYYLERHIQIDGDQHGPAAAELLKRRVNNHAERQNSILQAACRALEARIGLWDGVLRNIQSRL